MEEEDANNNNNNSEESNSEAGPLHKYKEQFSYDPIKLSRKEVR
jgi:hypothetical protein